LNAVISMKSYETAAYADFLLGAFRNPKGVSALAPSSPSLARAIAGEVDASREGLVVELGPGTGAVTSALLARGIASKRLLLVEREPEFVLILRRLYPALDVRCGDALRLEDYVKPTASVAAVVSGLPILHLPPEVRRQLVNRSLACQGAGGYFVQLSYGWQPPVPPMSGVSISKKTVWSNFPPAHIWTYRNR
jgi:phosphatidylethanolamine/phosphatidyl-N-methylethanolamine N-methyltransferase